MKFNLLKEFVILAEALNFTKAAQKLHLTQPVLSRHIKELEEFFGVELFFRDTHRVQLTPSGIFVFDEVRKIINQFEHSISNIHQFTGKMQQKLSIVYLGEAFNTILVKTIEEFHRNNENVNVTYRDCELNEVTDYLKNYEYDVGLTLRPNIISKNENFESLPLLTDNLCAVVNHSHPLAQKDSISLKEVANYPIIREDQKEVPHSEICSTNFLVANNIDFSVHKEYPNMKTCLVNISLNNNSIFLLPQHRLNLLPPNTVGISIDDECYYIMELIWDKNNPNKNIKKFIQEIKNHIF